MKVYTKTGDQGETSLFGGLRVSKGNLRIHAYGTVDELNSYIGLLSDLSADESRKSELLRIQDRLFTLGALLATEQEESKKKQSSVVNEEKDQQLLSIVTGIMNNSGSKERQSSEKLGGANNLISKTPRLSKTPRMD